MRRLIVNADDLGLTAGVNRAIREAHAEGIVTSATLMANGAAFGDAVELARSTPGLSVGCHVVLVDGAPLSGEESVSTLVTRRGASTGQFRSGILAVAARAALVQFDPDELVTEIIAQIQKIQAAGIQVTHLDTHKHTHIFPSILQAVVKAARICGVPAVRNPFVSSRSLRWQGFSQSRKLWKRYSQVRILNGYAARFRDTVKRSGLATPDGALGVIETGSLDPSLLRRALTDLPDGTWELVCHPGYEDEDLHAARTRLVASRETERSLLMSPELRQFLQEQSIQLMGYRELAGH